VKKAIKLVALILALTFTASCSGNTNGDEYLGGRTAEERDAVHIDIDLSWLSITVLSAEVTNIYNNGRENLGKTIRVRGTYDGFYHTQLNMVIHFILTFTDECCREGFEIRWSENHEPAGGFPPIGSFIEVDGVLRVHHDLGEPLLYLEVDEVFILR
jgi:hypothetical protein